MQIVQHTEKELRVIVSKEEESILLKTIDLIPQILSGSDFSTFLGINESDFPSLSQSLSCQFKENASDSGQKNSSIELSLDEIFILSNSLNLICNGFKIINFEGEIGASRKDARTLLEQIHIFLTSTNNTSQPIARRNRNKCYLDSEEYRISFWLQKINNPDGNIGVIVTLENSIDEHLQARTAAEPIYDRDSKRLMDFLENILDVVEKNIKLDSVLEFNVENIFGFCFTDRLPSGQATKIKMALLVKNSLSENSFEKNISNGSLVGFDLTITVEKLQGFLSSIQDSLILFGMN